MPIFDVITRWFKNEQPRSLIVTDKPKISSSIVEKPEDQEKIELQELNFHGNQVKKTEYLYV